MVDKEGIEAVLDKGGDEIAKYFAEAEHDKFEERIKRFEEFHDRNIDVIGRLAEHAEYVMMGHPSNSEEYPGVYTVAHKTLDEKVGKDSDKVTEDQVLEVIETYVDQFLQNVSKVEGHIKRTLDLAEKRGMSKDDLRRLKGRLFQSYHTDDNGRFTVPNPFDQEAIKLHAGKTKYEFRKFLRGLRDTSRNAYETLLRNQIDNLVKDTDLPELVEHIEPKFKERYEWKQDLLTKTANRLAQEYSSHLGGNDQQMVEQHGYKLKRDTNTQA